MFQGIILLVSALVTLHLKCYVVSGMREDLEIGPCGNGRQARLEVDLERHMWEHLKSSWREVWASKGKGRHRCREEKLANNRPEFSRSPSLPSQSGLPQEAKQELPSEEVFLWRLVSHLGWLA